MYCGRRYPSIRGVLVRLVHHALSELEVGRIPSAVALREIRPGVTEGARTKEVEGLVCNARRRWTVAKGRAWVRN